MFPQASAFLVFDPMFAFGHGIHIKAKTERKTGTFTASEQCLLQVTSVINTQHNSNLDDNDEAAVEEPDIYDDRLTAEQHLELFGESDDEEEFLGF